MSRSLSEFGPPAVHIALSIFLGRLQVFPLHGCPLPGWTEFQNMDCTSSRRDFRMGIEVLKWPWYADRCVR